MTLTCQHADVGGGGAVGRSGRRQREVGCGVMAFKSLMKAFVVS